MSEQPSEGSSAGPFLGALAIIVAVVIGILLFNVFSSDEPTPDQQIARAVSAQNDALQRRDYAGFLEYTCAAQHGEETEVLSAQRDSVDKHGERVVDRVAGVAIDGDRATAQVTYYFDKDPDAEETVDVELAREAGSWKVCSTGPS
ncbi:lumazine-binding protein [Mycobacterium sp. Y57]|uniref:Rv0361 family membrane protein n=1 Tax=Mycolicibacterium xanthum TaxID=2796469 RepID=UPI001C849599|nr:lumazine-binding protein [Mycolicibacterium xanthum]MBX7431958.1 lumazine-binding protein [Mycolicibacterium xanthum]